MQSAKAPRISATVILPKLSLQRVFDNLREHGFQLIGPTVRDGSVVLTEIASIADLPIGYALQQTPGNSRLQRTQGTDYFACTVGAHSWKRYLYPPRVDLLEVNRKNGEWMFESPKDDSPAFAFIGVRSCDLHAISMQDEVFLGSALRDPHYSRRRERAFILAVNCVTAAPTCFCTSMKTGPRVHGGFDLALTELPDSFAIEIGSEAGSDALDNVDWQPATAFDLSRVAQITHRTEQQIQRQIAINDLPQMLYERIDHPYWETFTARCLSCANCTMVCPTCFCSTVEDRSDLTGQKATRTRVWDSCFTLEFSHLHGGNSRPTIKSRFRQWMTHKMASWIDQFGHPGCVGCGRCIVWCPVGIDITHELSALRSMGAR